MTRRCVQNAEKKSGDLFSRLLVRCWPILDFAAQVESKVSEQQLGARRMCAMCHRQSIVWIRMMEPLSHVISAGDSFSNKCKGFGSSKFWSQEWQAHWHWNEFCMRLFQNVSTCVKMLQNVSKSLTVVFKTSIWEKRPQHIQPEAIQPRQWESHSQRMRREFAACGIKPFEVSQPIHPEYPWVTDAVWQRKTDK